MELNQEYWNQRYENQNTPWDLGDISPPLKGLIDDLEDRSLRILIPGAGNAHEAVYLHQKGFKQVFVCDWAEKAFNHLKSVCPTFPSSHLLIGDYFKMEGQFDLILEQTFFCALQLSKREQYVQHTSSLLKPGGMLTGLLFGVVFERPGPPFGGTEEQYKSLFSSHFTIISMETAQNSIASRQGNELFFRMKKG